MKINKLLLGVILIVAFAVVLWVKKPPTPFSPQPQPLWSIRSIDTVKTSRDLSREKLNDPSFTVTIDQQVKNIQQVGATHIAIATPYDDEFKPFLKVWVASARANNLHVWFRGNFAGWEKWFEYPPIDRAAHLEKTEKFILENPDLFEDGDIFTPCPECENGGPGDPRSNKDVLGHRKFLIAEYNRSLESFSKIGKKVHSGFFSMNYDVANLIMDQETTQALGGWVVIDHYVASPQKLSQDATLLAQKSGGKIVLGEYGAPIHDITGRMNEQEQAQWIKQSLTLLSANQTVVGVNYWVNVGGSTEIWDKEGNPKKAVDIIREFYLQTR